MDNKKRIEKLLAMSDEELNKVAENELTDAGEVDEKDLADDRKLPTTGLNAAERDLGMWSVVKKYVVW